MFNYYVTKKILIKNETFILKVSGNLKTMATPWKKTCKNSFFNNQVELFSQNSYKS